MRKLQMRKWGLGYFETTQQGRVQGSVRVGSGPLDWGDPNGRNFPLGKATWRTMQDFVKARGTTMWVLFNSKMLGQGRRF